ncbi:ABC transporter substrate-binding protein [Pseudoroseomonas deserti]|uniref:ABC transporter substrate-binding protein n=1 Tax=Teichococcus deserti TaxID=1817963 RepID=A0A1V2H100_9PROT|nr:ABC transporter substrate-binding protein [Pseudoroseomonas deserti]ONG51900.1 ABC transporter substrate-binding protein [Pseudoroseomonas deserti]
MLRRILFSAAAVLALAAATPLPAAQAQELRIGVRAGPEGIDPHFMALGNHAAALRNIFDSLVAVDEKLQVAPALATSWRAVDDLTWEFKLREGVKFHDGRPFTAADVKFSIERVKDAAGPDGGLVIYTRSIVAVDIVDDHTVRIRTNVPNAALPQDMTRLFIVSAGIAPSSKAPEFNSGAAAIGTGPFKFVSWTPRGDLVMERAPGYWGGEAPWSKVTLVEISNDAARVAGLLSNRVDFANYIPVSDIARLKRERNLSLYQGESIYTFILYPDMREDMSLPALRGITDKAGQTLPRNPFRDLRVRQALSLAIDRQAIAQSVFEGTATTAYQLMPSGMFGANPNPPRLPTDINRAKALLAEAGYPNGFRFPLFCSSDRLPGDGATCTALGQLFARVGLDVQVNAQPRTIFFAARTRGDYPVTMAGWGTLTGEAGYAVSSFIHTKEGPGGRYGAFNVSSYSNPELDKLIAEAMGTLNDDKRRALFQEIQAKAVADAGQIPIVILPTVWAGRANLTFTPRTDEETLAFHIRAK